MINVSAAPRALGAASWSRKGSPATGDAMRLAVFLGEQSNYGLLIVVKDVAMLRNLSAPKSSLQNQWILNWEWI